MYDDIETDIEHYKDNLVGKSVYCNTDDPKQSQFWQYFKDNYEELQLNSLLSTYHKEDETVYYTTYDGKHEGEAPW